MSGELYDRTLAIAADLVVLQALITADQLLQHQMIVAGGEPLDQEGRGVLQGLHLRGQGRLQVLLLLGQLLSLG